MYVILDQAIRTWLPGKIVKCSGPVSYKVQLDNDQIVHRHQDHLRKRSTLALIMTEDTSTGTPIIEAAPQQPRRNPHIQTDTHYKVLTNYNYIAILLIMNVIRY